MFRNIIETILSKGLSALCNLFILLITAKYLGAEGRGEMAVVVLGIAVIGIFQNILSGSVLTYLVPKFSTSALATAAVVWNALIALLLAPLLTVSGLYPQEYFGDLLILSFLQGGITLIQSILLGKEQIGKQNIMEVSKAFTTALFLLVFMVVLQEHSLSSVIDTFYCSYILVFLTGCFFLYPYLKREKHLHSGFTEVLHHLFKYGIQMQLNNISQMINYRFCFYLIEKKLGMAALGVFSVATSLVEMVWIVCKSVSNIHYSKTVNITDKELGTRFTIQLSKLSFLLTLPVLAVLLLIPDSIFLWIFGKEFHNLTPLLISMSPGVLFLAFFTILNHHFSGTGKNMVNLSGSVLGNIFTIAAGWILIPAWGNIGGGIATSIGYFVMLCYFTGRFTSTNQLNISWLYTPLKQLKQIFNLKNY